VTERGDTGWTRLPSVRIGAVVAIALAAAFAVWLLDRLGTARSTQHPGTKHPALSTEHPAPSTEHPAPSTEHRAPSTYP